MYGNQFPISHCKPIVSPNQLVTNGLKANFLSFQTKVIVISLPQPLGVRLISFYSSYHFLERVKSYATVFFSIKTNSKGINHISSELPSNKLEFQIEK